MSRLVTLLVGAAIGAYAYKKASENPEKVQHLKASALIGAAVLKEKLFGNSDKPEKQPAAEVSLEQQVMSLFDNVFAVLPKLTPDQLPPLTKKPGGFFDPNRGVQHADGLVFLAGSTSAAATVINSTVTIYVDTDGARWAMRQDGARPYRNLTLYGRDSEPVELDATNVRDFQQVLEGLRLVLLASKNK